MSTAAIEVKTANLRAALTNALALLGAYVLPRALTLGAIVVAARYLGAAQFGTYGTAAGLAVVLSVVATLGMTPLLTRDIARAPERAADLLSAAHAIKTCSNLLMLVSLILVLRWLDYPPPVRNAALLISFGYALAAYAENFSAYFQAIERMQIWTQASALYGLVAGSLGVLLALATRSIVWFALATVIGQLAALLYLRAQMPVTVTAARPRIAPTRELLHDLAPFAFAFIALTVYCKVDVLLLAQWSTPAQVGFYSAGYKFVDLMQALIIVAAAAVYPHLSRRTDIPDGQRWAGTRLIELVLLAVTVSAGLLWLMRAPLIGLLFGSEFRQAVAPVGFLAAALPALGVNIAAGYVLGVRGQMMRVALWYTCALVVNIALNRWFIPGSGATGAAAARFASELVLIGLLCITLQRYAAAAPGLRAVVTTITIGLACAAMALLPDPSNGILRGLGFLMLVALILAQLHPFTSDELAALLRVFRRGNVVQTDMARR